jgi:hypothetical protein
MSPANSAIIVYIIIIIIISITKPIFVYDHVNKKFRDFGFGNDKTILSLPFLSLFLAIFLYLIFNMIEKYLMMEEMLINNRKNNITYGSY